MTCVTPCDLCHTLESLHLAEGARDQSSFFVPGPAVQGRSSRAPSPAWRVTFLPRHPRMSSRRKRLCAGCTSQTRQDDLYSCGPTVNKLTQRLSYSSSYGQHAYLDTSIPGILTVTDARFPLLMKTLSPNSPLLPFALSAQTALRAAAVPPSPPPLALCFSVSARSPPRATRIAPLLTLVLRAGATMFVESKAYVKVSVLGDRPKDQRGGPEEGRT